MRLSRARAAEPKRGEAAAQGSSDSKPLHENAVAHEIAQQVRRVRIRLSLYYPASAPAQICGGPEGVRRHCVGAAIASPRWRLAAQSPPPRSRGSTLPRAARSFRRRAARLSSPVIFLRQPKQRSATLARFSRGLPGSVASARHSTSRNPCTLLR